MSCSEQSAFRGQASDRAWFFSELLFQSVAAKKGKKEKKKEKGKEKNVLLVDLEPPSFSRALGLLHVIKYPACSLLGKKSENGIVVQLASNAIELLPSEASMGTIHQHPWKIEWTYAKSLIGNLPNVGPFNFYK